MGMIETIKRIIERCTKSPNPRPGTRKQVTLHSITKEDVSTLPIVRFEKEIIIVDKDEQIRSALSYLRRYDALGFDTETRPSFQPKVSHKVSLLQLSTLDRCYLFRLHLLKDKTAIEKFMRNEKQLKIGVAIRDDRTGLGRVGVAGAAGFLELQQFVKQFGIEDNSLQRIFAILFGQKISKKQRLTNWERTELTDDQLIYAATDAWASLRIYQELVTQYDKK